MTDEDKKAFELLETPEETWAWMEGWVSEMEAILQRRREILAKRR